MITVIQHSPKQQTCTCPKCQSILGFLPEDIEGMSMIEEYNGKKLRITKAHITCPECKTSFLVHSDLQEIPEMQEEKGNEEKN